MATQRSRHGFPVMKHVQNLLKKLEPVLREALTSRTALSTHTIPGSAEAIYNWTLNQSLNHDVLVVTAGATALEERHQDLLTLAPKKGITDERLLYLPPADIHSETDLMHGDLDLTGLRVNTLLRMLSPPDAPRRNPFLAVTSIQALLQPVPQPSQLQDRTLTLSLMDNYERETLSATLIDLGYAPVPEVQDKAQFAIKGGIVDAWPITDDWPLRIEFFGSEVESIRAFDPVTQRSVSKPGQARFVPTRDPNVAQADSATSKTTTIRPYLPAGTIILWSDWDAIQEHAEIYTDSMAESDASLIALEDLVDELAASHPCQIRFEAAPNDPAPFPQVHPLHRQVDLPRDVFEPDLLAASRKTIFDDLAKRSRQREKVWMYLETKGSFEHISQELGSRAKQIKTIQGTLSSGWVWPDFRTIFVSESDVYGRKKARAQRYRPSPSTGTSTSPHTARVADLAVLEPDDLVVHVEHGVGRYLGVTEIDFNGQRQEVISIEYADNAKLHVPITHLQLLSRYVGVGDRNVRLHRLGGKRWEKDKSDAERAVRDLASSLLEVQAHRDLLKGFNFPEDVPWQRDFEAAFPFRETPDQIRVIADVKKDMESSRPMDRLICGDAGYGKTEVAMRAAFKAVLAGKQVAVLVPTTILAQQHYETFSERLSAYPFRVEALSRFCTQSARTAIVAGLRDGSIDIVIGTHALVQKHVAFQNLGLAIIDEEQRFGVAHKERLKQMRRMVDVLTLTATPIPRTLYMGLTGARDLSLLQTPPRERMPIETTVARDNDKVIVEAVRRELQREGQVFYLHNRVMTINRVYDRLRALLPEARIAVGHGQMSPPQLRAIMAAFVAGQYDVLLCTTIIESGVDIPRANTIVIDRADRFGIADLYQLRGRVGRSNRKAFAYLLLPAHGRIDSEARKRIDAIKRHSALGVGFSLAMRDLEIRGAGNLLGRNQSGHITAVGFGLYCQLLKRTVAQLKGEPLPTVIDVELQLDFVDLSPRAATSESAAALPYEYVDEEPLRLDVYKKLAEVVTVDDVTRLREELLDRFGPLPPPVKRLLQIADLRILAHAHQLQTVRVRAGRLQLARNGVYLKHGKRFPRLRGETPDMQLDEIGELIETLESWAAAAT